MCICHNNLVDESEADVSIVDYWRSTMMGNAARDPYWQAAVRKEVLVNPQYQEVIEAKCATCHMPMATYTDAARGGQGAVLDTGYLDPDGDLHSLAMDGVSCAVCHQIDETGLGEPESFGGGFAIDTERPVGDRIIFGPYQVGKLQANTMQVATGYMPIYGEHIAESALCATCHTLYTPYVDAAGEIAGVFPEQTAFLEWQHSDYVQRGRTCQDCHMPLAQGKVQTSITGGPPQSPFYKHSFVGGNAYMLRVIQVFGENIGVTASSDHYAHTIARANDQLGSHTAEVTLENVTLSDKLVATVDIESLTGHKLPTGFPARRVWLRFTVLDASGNTVFESGAFEANGSISGNDNDSDPSGYEPHYQQITSPDQVQIYESIMHDTEENVTTVLLHGAGYAKDNRLLPAGFDKGSAADDIAVRGQAAEDEDFGSGGDRVQYAVDLGDAQGPFTVEVELLYQSVGYRWAEDLRQYASAETATFLDYYGSVPNLPAVISTATTKVAE